MKITLENIRVDSVAGNETKNSRPVNSAEGIAFAELLCSDEFNALVEALEVRLFGIDSTVHGHYELHFDVAVG